MVSGLGELRILFSSINYVSERPFSVFKEAAANEASRVRVLSLVVQIHQVLVTKRRFSVDVEQELILFRLINKVASTRRDDVAVSPASVCHRE